MKYIFHRCDDGTISICKRIQRANDDGVAGSSILAILCTILVILVLITGVFGAAIYVLK